MSVGKESGARGPGPDSVRLGPGGLEPHDGVRDLFPIPRRRLGPRPPDGHGRAASRWRARQRVHSLVDAAVKSLNWLHGEALEAWPQRSEEPMHSAVQDYLHGLVTYEQREDVLEIEQTPQAAFQELLRGRGSYGGSTASDTMAPFKSGFVALPTDTVDAPSIESLVGSEGHLFLEREGERMRRPEDEVRNDEELEKQTVYSDPTLVRHRRKYATFVKDLASRSMVAFTRRPKETVGVFFVWKKGRVMRRLIIDARRANRHFRRAPHVDLVTGEGLAAIELELTQDDQIGGADLEAMLKQFNIHIGISDVKDAFFIG